MRIDAHQHYWRIDRGDYGWLTPQMPLLYRDFLPHDLEPHLKRHRLDRTIVVQAAPTVEETEYLLSLADESATIAVVVGWLDLHDPRQRSHFERFRRHPKYVGFRIMIQEMPDASRILERPFIQALREYAEADVPVDLLVKSNQLSPLLQLLEQVPGLRGVIDHIAKPRIADGVMEPWRTQMSEAAKHPNIYCKLSGMVTEANHLTWKANDFTSYIHHTLDIFGPKRVMFGSDWPVCLLAAGYDEVVNVLEQALPASWSEQEKDALFGLNAKAFYKL